MPEEGHQHYSVVLGITKYTSWNPLTGFNEVLCQLPSAENDLSGIFSCVSLVNTSGILIVNSSTKLLRRKSVACDLVNPRSIS